MKQMAEVVSVGGKLMGKVVRPEACMKCRSCDYGQKAETFVELPSGDWQVGDSVEIELGTGKLSKASLFAYGIPLVTMLVFLVIAHFVIASEIVQALVGIAGALAGFFVLHLLEPKFGSYRPKTMPCSRRGE